MISQTETPVTSNLVVEAARAKLLLNILVSVPLTKQPSFNHHQTVDEVAALCGFTKLIKT